MVLSMARLLKDSCLVLCFCLIFTFLKKVSVGVKVIANLEKKVKNIELAAVETRRTTSKTVC